jgi:ASC-1-like (ASCH) protein
MLCVFKKYEMIHELKTWNEYFEEVFMGHKTFEIRKNDRNFQKGDTLILKEWNPKTEQYTGREMVRNVTYIPEGGSFGLEKGFVIMAIA